MNIQNFEINLHHYKDYVPLSQHISWRMSKDRKSHWDFDHGEQKLGVAGNRGSGLFHNFWKYSNSYILGTHQSLFPLLLTPEIKFFLSSFKESVSHIKLRLIESLFYSPIRNILCLVSETTRYWLQTEHSLRSNKRLLFLSWGWA